MRIMLEVYVNHVYRFSSSFISLKLIDILLWAIR
jgi:hypothetical protein